MADDMADDEQVVGGYCRHRQWLILAVPLVVAYFVDLNWTIAIGVAVLIDGLISVDQRLFDLCVRVRRTNTSLLQLSDVRAKLDMVSIAVSSI